MPKDAALEQLRAICLSLPDAKESLTWGKPHFRVGEKIFAGYGEFEGRPVVGFKLDMSHAAAVVHRPHFARAPYVGHKGWVVMDTKGVRSWSVVRELILESYRLMAPKKSLAKLDDSVAKVPVRKLAAVAGASAAVTPSARLTPGSGAKRVR